MAEKVDEEKGLQLEAENRHEELISSLKDIADRSNVDDLVKKVSELVDVMKQPKTEKESIDLSPIAKELSSGIAELKTVLEVRPKAFNIERNKVGLITKIVPEY
jgi:ribosomal protein L18E